MRIVIDLQGAQTVSRFRGIGRYCLSLTRELIKNRGENEIILALNGLLSDTIASIRDEFDDMLPQENIRVWKAPGPVQEFWPCNELRRKSAEFTREFFLESLNPDIILISSLFEGFYDDGITSIGLFDTNTPVFVIHYDLIPLLNPELYLNLNLAFKKHYLKKIEYLKRAKGWLCISSSSGKEAKESLGIDENKIVNISSACDDRFRKIEILNSDEKDLRKKFQIELPFILYIGGSDGRKNLHGLIRAYAGLSKELREGHQLVLIGKMPKGDIRGLRKTAKTCGLAANQVLFHDFITDKELVQLYNLCKLFVFPSRHEGFGLPVLEAMACGAPVICGNLSSLPEVINNRDAVFDPNSVNDISVKITNALINDKFRTQLIEHGLKQSKKFSWKKSARQALTVIEEFSGSNPIYPDGRYYSKTSKYSYLIESIASFGKNFSSEDFIRYSYCINNNLLNGKERQLFIDISVMAQKETEIGVQSAVKRILKELIMYPPDDFRPEPVYADGGGTYRYARAFTCSLVGLRNSNLKDDPINWNQGDIFFGLDSHYHLQLNNRNFYQQLRESGVTVKFMVNETLPLEQDDQFCKKRLKEIYINWLKMITENHGAIFQSKANSNAFRKWLKENDIICSPDFQNDWLYQKVTESTCNSRYKNTNKIKRLLIDKNFRNKQLLVDISDLVQHDSKRSYHKFVSSILKELFENPQIGRAHV